MEGVRLKVFIVSDYVFDFSLINEKLLFHLYTLKSLLYLFSPR